MTKILETTHNSVLCKTLSFISVLSADTRILINKWINKCTESKILASKGRMKTSSFKCQIKVAIEGLPWWCSGWESACQCGGHGFEPWSGGIPHAAERLGPWATITEPARLEPELRNKRGRDNERPAHCDEEWPPLATTRESPRTETKTQHSH